MGVEDHLGPRVRTFFSNRRMVVLTIDWRKNLTLWIFEHHLQNCGGVTKGHYGRRRKASKLFHHHQAKLWWIMYNHLQCMYCTHSVLKKVSFSLRLFGSVQHCAVCVQLLWHVASLSVTSRVLLTKACWEPYKLSSIYPLPYHASRTMYLYHLYKVYG